MSSESSIQGSALASNTSTNRALEFNTAKEVRNIKSDTQHSIEYNWGVMIEEDLGFGAMFGLQY